MHQRILSAALCLLLLMTIFIPASAENVNLHDSDIVSVCSDSSCAVITNSDGSLYMIKPDADEKIFVGRIDPETQFPAVYQGKVFIYSQEREQLECIWPENENIMIPMELPEELTQGSSAWSLSAVKMTESAFYCIFDNMITEKSSLCRFDFSDKAFRWKQYSGPISYTLDENENTFLVVYEGGKTSISRHIWETGADEPDAELNGKFNFFESLNGIFYGMDAGSSSFVSIQNGKTEQSVYSPEASSVAGSCMINGNYMVLSASGLYAPDFDAASESKIRTLRIEGSGPNPVDQGFLMMHPDVRMEYVSSDSYQAVGKYTAIATGIVQMDVIPVDNSSAAKSFFKKGYALDLSVFPWAQQEVSKMYQPIRDFVFHDGTLQMIPCSIRIDNLWEKNSKNIGLAGLTEDQIPLSMEELLNLIIDWESIYDDDTPIVPMLFDESPRRELLYLVLNAYIDHADKNGLTLDFSTPAFRHLLELADLASGVSSVQTEDYNPLKLYLNTGLDIPSVHSVTFPAEEGEKYFTGSISAWAIYAGSEAQDLAEEYIEYRMGLISDAQRFLLYDGQYLPLEKDSYLKDAAAWREQLADLQMQYDSEEDDAQKEKLEKAISEIKQKPENTPDYQRYVYTADEIDFYQNSIIPSLTIHFRNPVLENSAEDGAWAWKLINQYCDGAADEGKLIGELNHRVQMMRLEDED